jgi:hypothetical protein
MRAESRGAQAGDAATSAGIADGTRHWLKTRIASGLDIQRKMQ